MIRQRDSRIDAGGQDSFLDIVTNIVGILIILVMVIGARVQTISLKPKDQSSPDVLKLMQEVVRLEDAVVASESELIDLDKQGEQLTLTVADAGNGRMHLITAVSATRRDVEEKKLKIDEDKAERVEMVARSDRLRDEIEQCKLEAEGISHAPQETKKLLAYPTPVGRTVTGDELHFRLAAGRIAYIPLTELFDRAKARTQRSGGGSLASMESRVETVGPIQDFALDYVIEVQINRSIGQVYVRSREWVVKPAYYDLGETLPDALARQSRFRNILAGVTPATTVTLWCYPDSFEEYLAVREELHRLGVSAACRPLPEGAPIGGSAEGSKSVAQ